MPITRANRFVGVVGIDVLPDRIDDQPVRSPSAAAALSATGNEPVLTMLGTPIEPGWFITGNIDYDGGSGTVDLSISVSGPDGKGTIYVVGRRAVGEWDYSALVFHDSGSGESVSPSPE